MSSTKSSVACQKASLLVPLASLNNDHNSNLHACYVGVRSPSWPNLVPVMPLRPRSAAWRFLFIANLSKTAPEHVPTVKVEARAVKGHCRTTTMTLARSFIRPYNNSVLNYCTNLVSVSPSLASKPMRCRLNLCSSCLGASAKVSTARLTT